MACLAVVALAAACQSDTHAVFSPVPSPTPHTDPTVAILQSADVPAALDPCLGSGPLDVYVAQLGRANATIAARVSAQWQALRSEGAEAGAISVFASDPSACQSELGTTGTAKAMTSIVAVFADPGQADRAWLSAVFGFTPPPTGDV